MDANSESIYVDFALTTAYQTYSLDLLSLKQAGFDLASPQAIIVAATADGDYTSNIDVDDITLNL